MKILLTGATGFLGSHLLKAMLRAGYEIAIIKRATSDLGRIAEVEGKYDSFDVPETELTQIFSEHPIDLVCHCATTYGRGQVETTRIVDGNLRFPIELLENAMQNGCKYFINTDSFFCKQLPDRLERNEPIYMPEYTLTKHQFREWGKLYANQGKITFINLQMEHIYGPNDSLGKFVPWVESQFANNTAEIDLTDGIQLRDFVYVDDVVNVYLDILKRIKTFKGYASFEVGSGQAMSVRQFVEQLKEKTGASTKLNFGAIPRKEEEIMYSKASSHSPYSMSNFKASID